MAIEITDLSELSASEVQQKLAELTARVQELNPDVDLSSGPFRDYISYLSAVLETSVATNLDRIRKSDSIAEIEKDPSLAEDDVVDNVLSNFRIERSDGEAAQGSITIVVSSNTTVTIGAGAIFEADGKQFTSDQSYVAKAEEDQVVSSSDRLLTLLNDGNYGFNIDVTAVEVGADHSLKKDTAVTPVSPPLNFVRAFSAKDFTGGRDVETNSELLSRLQEGLAARTISNRVTMNALLRSIEDFENVIATSVVGFGDPEMLRDSHTIFPLSFGGRVDWYVRSEPALQRIALTKEAVLMTKTSDGYGEWQFSLLRDDFPGFYEVESIRPTGDTDTTTFEVLSDSRDNDLSGDDFVPDIQTTAEGAYSRYQTTTITFKDTETETAALSAGDKRSYDVTVSGMTMIGDIQDYMNDRSVRPYGSDLLVKAPVPCFVSLSFTIYKQTGDDSPDLDAIRSALIDKVNAIGFTGRLSSSSLFDVVHGFLDDRTTVSAIDMLARIRRPDGSQKYLRDYDAIVVPDEPENMVTARTVQFYVTTDSIGISVETVGPTAD